MRRTLASMAVVAALAWSVPAHAADGDGKVSGRLMEIRPDGKLVIEEQGPWHGPGSGLITRTVDLTPATSIRVVRPTGRWEASDAVPGYDVQDADFRALKPGDFVTVTIGAPSTATAVDVMRTDGGAGLASPHLDAGGK